MTFEPKPESIPALLILLLSLHISLVSLHAQESDERAAAQDKATLFWNSRSSRGPRLDLSEEPGVFLYIEQLRNKRPDDKLVYILYGPLGQVGSYSLRIREWLLERGNITNDKLLIFDGGREARLRYEAWLVAEGAEIPTAKTPVEDEEAVIEFTSYPYDKVYVCEECGSEKRFTLEALVEALRQRARRKAYLEFYGCGGGTGRRRRSSVARLEASEAKRLLIKDGRVSPERIIFKIKAGGKQRCAAQVWLLPPRLNSLP